VSAAVLLIRVLMRGWNYLGALGLGVGVLACGAETDGGNPGAAGAGSGGVAGSSGASAAGPNVEQPFHLEGLTDAYSLGFLDDGIFVLSVFGCDFCSVNGGRWRRESDVIVLEPLDATTPIHWADGSELAVDVTGGTVRTGAAQGTVDVSVVRKQGGTIEQTWQPGRMCAICGGDLGPTGRTVCDLPLSTNEDEACAEAPPN
jgi:hypothetical protein